MPPAIRTGLKREDMDHSFKVFDHYRQRMHSERAEHMQHRKEQGIRDIVPNMSELHTMVGSKPKKMAIKHLTLIQGSTQFDPEYAKTRKFKDKRPINVYHHEGKHYVVDGYHRLIAAKLHGETHIKAHILDGEI